MPVLPITRPPDGSNPAGTWRRFHDSLKRRSKGEFTPTGHGYIQTTDEKGRTITKLFEDPDNPKADPKPRFAFGYGTLVERELVGVHRETMELEREDKDNKIIHDPSQGVHLTAGAYDPDEITYVKKPVPARVRGHKTIPRQIQVIPRANEKVLVMERSRARGSDSVVTLTEDAA